jgi:hypothetical protein
LDLPVHRVPLVQSDHKALEVPLDLRVDPEAPVMWDPLDLVD